MKKKKLALISSAAILSLALAGTIGVVAASADTITNGGDNTAQTTVTYSVGNTWTVEIPNSIVLNSSEKTTAEVKARDVVIEQGQTLSVTVSSTNNWRVENGGNGFDYTLKSDKATSASEALNNSSNNTVLTVTAGTVGETTANLTAELTDANKGKYSTGGKSYEDTLTFTVDDGATGD